MTSASEVSRKVWTASTMSYKIRGGFQPDRTSICGQLLNHLVPPEFYTGNPDDIPYPTQGGTAIILQCRQDLRIVCVAIGTDIIIEGFFNPKKSEDPDDGPCEYYETLTGTAIIKVEETLRLETKYVTTVKPVVLPVRCVSTGVEFIISIAEENYDWFNITLTPEL